MNEIFNLITKLRVELETCRSGNNDTQVMNAVQTLNKVDNLLLKQVNGLSTGDGQLTQPVVIKSVCQQCGKPNDMNYEICSICINECRR